jgi:hypothetical protein
MSSTLARTYVRAKKRPILASVFSVLPDSAHFFDEFCHFFLFSFSLQISGFC